MSQFFKGNPGSGAIGDVTGPGSSTDNAIARFDGITGKIIQNSVVVIDDLGNLDSEGTSVGAEKSFLNQNNDNTAGSAAKISVLVGGSSAGDAYNEFSIDSTRSYSIGIDNDDSQTLKITTAAATNVDPSSGTSLLEITSAGEVSFPSATLTQYGVVTVGASGLLTSTAVGASGQVLTSSGAGLDPTWTTVAGTGDVTAAAALTDNAIIRGDGGAKGVQDSGIIIDDSDNVTGVVALTAGSLTLTTDLAVAHGGTGASTLTGVLTGNGASAITANAVTEYGVLVGGASNSVSSTAVGTAGHVLTSNGAGFDPTFQAVSGTVTSVSGTTNRISSTGGATPVIDIDAAYVGQTSLTTLGTIASGTWNGTSITEGYGGTNQSTYATGDILYASASNTLSKLAVGSNTEVLTLAGGVPTWAAAGGSSPLTTNGDMYYYASGADARLPAAQCPNVLIMGDDGLPSWSDDISYFFDDFFYNRTTATIYTPWNFSADGTGSSTQTAASVADHPGIVTLDAGTTTTGFCTCSKGDNADGGNILLGSGVVILDFIINIPTLSTASEEFKSACGLSTVFNIYVSFYQNEQLLIVYDRLQSTDWIGITRNGGSETAATGGSSVAVATGWTHARIVVNAAASSVEFFINGTSIGTCTTNIPTTDLNIGFMHQKSAGTTSRLFSVDCVRFYHKLTTSRFSA